MLLIYYLYYHILSASDIINLNILYFILALKDNTMGMNEKCIILCLNIY